MNDPTAHTLDLTPFNPPQKTLTMPLQTYEEMLQEKEERVISELNTDPYINQKSVFEPLNIVPEYFSHYTPTPFICVGVIILALCSLQSKQIEKKNFANELRVIVAALVFMLCQFIYFSHQHNTPHVLVAFETTSVMGKVKIDDIVSAEINSSYLTLTLNNGSELSWPTSLVQVHSKTSNVIASKKHVYEYLVK